MENLKVGDIVTFLPENYLYYSRITLIPKENYKIVTARYMTDYSCNGRLAISFDDIQFFWAEHFKLIGPRLPRRKLPEWF